jgi:hypothetical protein
MKYSTKMTIRLAARSGRLDNVVNANFLYVDDMIAIVTRSLGWALLMMFKTESVVNYIVQSVCNQMAWNVFEIRLCTGYQRCCNSQKGDQRHLVDNKCRETP